MEKVVLAREVIVSAAAAHDPAPIFGAMREQFPACFCFCAGTPEAAFVGASPELLVRRSGAGVSTVALAGSTRRSSDPAVDDHLGERLLRSDKDRREHRIVAERIVRRAASARGLGRDRRRAGDRQGRQHPAPGDAGDRPARRAALGDRAGRDAPPDPGGRRRALARRGGGARRARAAWTAAGTPPRSAGWTPPRTANSASPSAAPSCATATPTSSPASASSPAPTPRPSSPRPRSSSQAMLPLVAR